MDRVCVQLLVDKRGILLRDRLPPKLQITDRVRDLLLNLLRPHQVLHGVDPESDGALPPNIVEQRHEREAVVILRRSEAVREPSTALLLDRLDLGVQLRLLRICVLRSELDVVVEIQELLSQLGLELHPVALI